MDRVEQYNRAGQALAAAVEGVRTASDDDLAAAEQTFRDAQAEFSRCEANLRVAEEAAAIPSFTPRSVSDPTMLGMDQRQVRQYSLMRAIRALVAGDWTGAELEREASETIGEALGRQAQGFFLPSDIQNRAMTVGTDADGGYLVDSELRPQSFIELQRNRMMVLAAGATVLSGLVGDVAIPRQTGGATFYWVDEGVAVTESKPALGQIALTPHTGGGYTDLTRKLINQASLDVEQFVMTDLAAVTAIGIDAAALHGTAANDQPRGIAATSGIGSVVGDTNGKAPDWGHIIDLESEVAIDNADVGNLAYMTNAKVRGKLKKTLITATYGEDFIWDRRSPEAPLNGYKCHVTNQVSSTLTKGNQSLSSAIFFGNWNDLVIGQWGTIDITVDPYALATSGGVRVIALQDVDVAVRHAASFAAMLDALT